MLSERARRLPQPAVQAPSSALHTDVHNHSTHVLYPYSQSSSPRDPAQHEGYPPRQSIEAKHDINRQPQRAFPSTSFKRPSDASEHLLRRKTPNGTLSAAYDGSPVDWMQKPHPPKQLLMPISNFSSMTPVGAQYGTQLVDRPRSQALSPNSSKANSSHHKDFGRHGSSLHSAYARPKTAGNPSSGVPLLIGMDSVLNQPALQGYPFNTASIQSVPTVLQPLWPPCLGPTSLHTPGPFGPYWPDGAFEPYRPAPLRDTDHPQARNVEVDAAAVQRHQPAFSHEDTASNSQLSRSVKPFEYAYHVRHNTQQEKRKHLTSNGPWTGSLSHGFYVKRTIGQDQPFSSIHDFANTQGYGSGKVSGDTWHAPNIASGHAQFKERILNWAHRIYCSLIASIEASRKVQQTGIQESSTNSSNIQRPRRPYPSWSSKQSQPKSLPRAHETFGAASSVDADTSSNQSNMTSWDSIHLKQTRDHIQPCSPLRDSSPCLGLMRRAIGPTNVPFQHSRAQQSSLCPSYIPQQLAQEQSTSSPIAAAFNAMEILSQLCQESHWKWLDGMLLNGCLAYGLGDYSKATKWYTKVLHRDAGNVEAMSNLAATLLSLGRRQEAEQYWTQAVKQRPRYFEAVEHLVGLLHEENRGKEAVDVIQYVETALREDMSRWPSGHAQVSQHSKTGPSGYGISPSDNGRLLTLIHGKGNVLYQSGNNGGAAKAFEDAILIGTYQYRNGISGLINHISKVFAEHCQLSSAVTDKDGSYDQPVLLPPEAALETSRLIFPPDGVLPGLELVPKGMAQKAAVSIISNSLLSLAKIYQDSMSSSGAPAAAPRASAGVQEILALYYLSLSLQPSPSTANNVGILLAGIQQPARLSQRFASTTTSQSTVVSGVVRGSGVALALAYYEYGLKLDARHAHLYTNLGSLFKDIGQLSAAIKMYEKAVECDDKFDIALANLANAVKDKGNIKDAIHYYKRAVASNPDFAEAVCGLANALNSVCSWSGRGGVSSPGGKIDRWHVDEQGLLFDSNNFHVVSSGWMHRVVRIVQRQLEEGRGWGKGVILSVGIVQLIEMLKQSPEDLEILYLRRALESWTVDCWEGARIVRLVERATKDLTWRVYKERSTRGSDPHVLSRERPQLPAVLAVPSAPTVLPFHTFTCPLSAKQIRLISQRNGLRVSCTTLRAPWLPSTIYEPPPVPCPYLNVGYISSDFNNHPLAHLMQSVFGLHNPAKVRSICYATTASDGSVHRQKIEQESPAFYDCSSWSVERLVNQVVADRIHILVNLNGYTRGAKNEVFAARPAPIQMSFMGFAGTLGAEWCDYLLADRIAIPPSTLRPNRRNVNIVDQIEDCNNDDVTEGWVYGENIIFTRDTFFCCDHRQSAPGALEEHRSWPEEQRLRWRMRKELFPDLADDMVILANFNQLYKIEPTTFRSWLRILSRVPKAVLWLLRFPDIGEQHLRRTAFQWVGAEVASRLVFTDVAPKQQHIARARICDLFVDTPECNAHTTAADVLWSGTPLLTYPKYEYKMCARMAASILRGALPKNAEGKRAAEDLIATSDEAYEEQGVELSSDLVYPLEQGEGGLGEGRLMELRKLLYEGRWTSALFDTRRWVEDLETAYAEAWRRWVEGEGGDIWL